eukprot:scaffold726_cov320-Prasinococcus_capsulatus_cf.AAC.4
MPRGVGAGGTARAALRHARVRRCSADGGRARPFLGRMALGGHCPRGQSVHVGRRRHILPPQWAVRCGALLIVTPASADGSEKNAGPATDARPGPDRAGAPRRRERGARARAERRKQAALLHHPAGPLRWQQLQYGTAPAHALGCSAGGCAADETYFPSVHRAVAAGLLHQRHVLEGPRQRRPGVRLRRRRGPCADRVRQRRVSPSQDRVAAPWARAAPRCSRWLRALPCDA